MVAVRPLNAPPALPAVRDCLEGLCFTRVVPEEVMVAEGDAGSESVGRMLGGGARGSGTWVPANLPVVVGGSFWMIGRRR